MVVVPSTLELSDLWVSSRLLEESKTLPYLEPQGGLQPLPLDEKGNLLQNRLFPHSVRARRNHPAFQ